MMQASEICSQMDQQHRMFRAHKAAMISPQNKTACFIFPISWHGSDSVRQQEWKWGSLCHFRKTMLARWVWTLHTVGLIELCVDEKLGKRKWLEWIRRSEERKRVQKKRAYQQSALHTSFSSSGRQERLLPKLSCTPLSLSVYPCEDFHDLLL